jgi:hypothetical protein
MTTVGSGWSFVFGEYAPPLATALQPMSNGIANACYATYRNVPAALAGEGCTLGIELANAVYYACPTSAVVPTSLGLFTTDDGVCQSSPSYDSASHTCTLVSTQTAAPVSCLGALQSGWKYVVETQYTERSQPSHPIPAVPPVLSTCPYPTVALPSSLDPNYCGTGIRINGSVYFPCLSGMPHTPSLGVLSSQDGKCNPTSLAATPNDTCALTTMEAANPSTACFSLPGDGWVFEHETVTTEHAGADPSFGSIVPNHCTGTTIPVPHAFQGIGCTTGLSVAGVTYYACPDVAPVPGTLGSNPSFPTCAALCGESVKMSCEATAREYQRQTTQVEDTFLPNSCLGTAPAGWTLISDGVVPQYAPPTCDHIHGSCSNTNCACSTCNCWGAACSP